MGGFEVTGTNIVVPALFASAPKGEPTFIFVVDSSSDGKESTVVVSATLEWVQEQFYDFLHDNRREKPVDYLTAYVLLPGTQEIVQCGLREVSGDGPGEGSRIEVSSGGRTIALYDI